MIAKVFENNLAARQSYRLTCMMSNLTKQAFYAGVGTTSPYSHRNNGFDNFNHSTDVIRYHVAL